MARQLKVAVIGAGPAGLVTARELQREGHQVVVFEKSDQIGGTWVYTSRVESEPLGLDPDREIVHSSVYYSLRTNLPRHLMGFSDYPFTIRRNGGEVRDFPGHQEVLEFLNQFVRDFGLMEVIRLNHEVVRVEKEDELWVVEYRLSDKSCSEELFEAVVVCNGHHTQPKLAEDIPGVKLWPGKQIHSHNYRVPEPFQDKVIVLIGSESSAHDICQDLAQDAREVHLSSRSPEVKVSKIDNFSNVWQHQEITCCHENGEVEFMDGASVAADIILHCTGYKYDFPFLKTNGIVTVDDNRVGPLYKHIFPPEYAPRLSFIGLPHRVVIFLMLELQARWVAFALSGKATLPTKEGMLADVEEHYRQMEQDGVGKHHTQRLPIDAFVYLDWMAAETGCSVSEQTKLVYYTILKYIGGLLWFASKKDVDIESVLTREMIGSISIINPSKSDNDDVLGSQNL